MGVVDWLVELDVGVPATADCVAVVDRSSASWPRYPAVSMAAAPITATAAAQPRPPLRRAFSDGARPLGGGVGGTAPPPQ